MKRILAEELDVINNTKKFRFELHSDRDMAFVDYVLDVKEITLINTTIPASLIHVRGVGNTLVKEILAYCKKNKLSLLAQCPYADAILRSLQLEN